MAHLIIPIAGAALATVITAAEVTSSAKTVPFSLGATAIGNDGRLYVFAKANAAIPASTAVSAVAPTTFLATASGGAYTSPAAAMVVGDYGWFSKALV